MHHAQHWTATYDSPGERTVRYETEEIGRGADGPPNTCALFGSGELVITVDP